MARMSSNSCSLPARNTVCVFCSRGGNYLLNVGPRPDGTVPEECVEVLNKVGAYVTANKEAIIGTKMQPTEHKMFANKMSNTGYYTKYIHIAQYQTT